MKNMKEPSILKTWTGILLMIILAVAVISAVSTAHSTNEQAEQLPIDNPSSQAEAVVASNIDSDNDEETLLHSNEILQDTENVSIAPENENIRLYPMQVEGSGYIYNGITLEVNGKEQHFPAWKAEGGSYKPEVHELDLNGDGRKEILVLLTAGHGTGIYLGKAYIVDPDTLTEMNMQPLDEVVQQHVASRVNVTPGKVDINVDIDGKPAASTRLEEETEGVDYNKELEFGSVVYYSIDQDRLTVSASGAYSFGMYGGELRFRYELMEGQWKATGIDFNSDTYEEEYMQSFD